MRGSSLPWAVRKGFDLYSVIAMYTRGRHIACGNQVQANINDFMHSGSPAWQLMQNLDDKHHLSVLRCQSAELISSELLGVCSLLTVDSSGCISRNGFGKCMMISSGPYSASTTS